MALSDFASGGSDRGGLTTDRFVQVGDGRIPVFKHSDVEAPSEHCHFQQGVDGPRNSSFREDSARSALLSISINEGSNNAAHVGVEELSAVNEIQKYRRWLMLA